MRAPLPWAHTARSVLVLRESEWGLCPEAAESAAGVCLSLRLLEDFDIFCQRLRFRGLIRTTSSCRLQLCPQGTKKCKVLWNFCKHANSHWIWRMETYWAVLLSTGFFSFEGSFLLMQQGNFLQFCFGGSVAVRLYFSLFWTRVESLEQLPRKLKNPPCIMKAKSIQDES